MERKETEKGKPPKHFIISPVNTTLSSPVRVSTTHMSPFRASNEKEVSLDQVVVSSGKIDENIYKPFQNIDGMSFKRITGDGSPSERKDICLEREIHENTEDKEGGGPHKNIPICREFDGVELKQQNGEELTFSNWELFKISFFPSVFLTPKLKANLKLLKEGEINLHKYIDVYQMIKRFQETENLKQGF